MNVTALLAFYHSPAGIALDFVDQFLCWVTLLAQWGRIRSVPGSHRRYVAGSVLRTILLPTFALQVYDVAVSCEMARWAAAGFDVVNLWILSYYWHDAKDEDDWWTGRGKKLKQWFRKTFTLPSPAAAGAGA